MKPLHRTRALLASSLALLMFFMASLACTANDTLFIRLTDTPVPTATPTPLPITTKFKVGESGVVVGLSEFAAVSLPASAGPLVPGIGGATCFPNTRVTVLDVSRNINDPNDETIYYLVQCSGRGWIAEYQFSRFNRGDKAIVQTADGSDARLYRQSDVTSAPLDQACPNGTEVSVTGLTANPFNPNDRNIYVQVRCGTVSGWLLEEQLAPLK
ncbi:MAG: hypothetical protein CUN49_04410 [Candidatus Thermofonsia Clade 1 bacterium]|uniref:SH3b domain-containing protein n=1 Tax=Candidatus Thermofonsia Clade 1 bacterium TaxID=2364210 RepID=A0A2M8PGH3_9CHLR|nr:MAG: hypothetical protein CUN49_04410 [Candidatus Thermofonsia Clade 1 bacterium]